MEGDIRAVGNRFEAVDTAFHLAGGRLLLANGVLRQVGEAVRYTEDAEVTLEHLFLDDVAQVLSGPPSARLEGYLANNVMQATASALPEELGEGSRVVFTHSLVSPSLATALRQHPAVKSDVLIEAMSASALIGSDGSLLPQVAGRLAGTHGQDLGVQSSPLAAITGAPPARTSGTSLVLGVHGSGWEQFEYQLNGGPWTTAAIPWLPSPDTLREARLPFDGLTEGDHVLRLRERSEAPVRELRWTISTVTPIILINEVAAINATQNLANGFPDWAELINTANVAVDLGDYQLRDLSEGGAHAASGHGARGPRPPRDPIGFQ